MKKGHFLSVFLLVFTFISCSSDHVETIDENQTLSSIIKDASDLANNEHEAISFDIAKQDGQYISKNLQTLETPEFVIDFAAGFANTRYQNTVTIACSDGTVTTCAGNDGACVGAAIKACLDGGGCASVCRATLTVYPKQKEQL